MAKSLGGQSAQEDGVWNNRARGLGGRGAKLGGIKIDILTRRKVRVKYKPSFRYYYTVMLKLNIFLEAHYIAYGLGKTFVYK